MGLVQGICCLLITFIHFSNPVYIMLCACAMSMALAFMDVVVDGLMVLNARLDPKAGSEELQVFSWGFFGLGGTFGCLAAGLLLNPKDPITQDPAGYPYVCFLLMMLFGFGISVSGFFIDKRLEINQQSMIEMGFSSRSKFVLKEVCQGMKIKEMYSTVIFAAVLGGVVPNFGTYLYYYQIKVTLFT